MDLSKGYEKITIYKILLITSFSEFSPKFGNISAKCRIRQCRFGEVSLQQSGFWRSVTDPFFRLLQAMQNY